MATQHFGINDEQTEELEHMLFVFASRALPFAVRNTIKDTAFLAQRFARQDVDDKFILRNKHSQRSIRVDKSAVMRELKIDRMHASTGSDESYMARQEFGGRQVAKGTEGKPIYTSQAAGLGDSSPPVKKLPRAPNKMSRIQLKKNKLRAKSRRQAFFFAAVQTLEERNKYAFIDDNEHTKGIYRIQGRLNRKGSWKIKNLKMKLIWDLSRKSVTNAKEPWLLPASQDAAALQPAIYRKRLNEQLVRHRIFNK